MNFFVSLALKVCVDDEENVERKLIVKKVIMV